MKGRNAEIIEIPYMVWIGSNIGLDIWKVIWKVIWGVKWNVKWDVKWNEHIDMKYEMSSDVKYVQIGLDVIDEISK